MEVDTASSSGSSSISRSSSPFEPLPELLDEYTRLIASQFEDLASTGLLPTQPIQGDSDGEETGEGGRAMTKAEKQNAKKKRRKERERLAREQAAGGSGNSKKQSDVVGKSLSLIGKRWKGSY